MTYVKPCGPKTKAKKLAWRAKRAARQPIRARGRVRARSTNKFTPHQGASEFARRVRQREALA